MYVWVYACMCRCLQRPEEGIIYPGNTLTGVCETSEVLREEQETSLYVKNYKMRVSHESKKHSKKVMLVLKLFLKQRKMYLRMKDQ